MTDLDQQLFNNPDPQAVRSLLQRGANSNVQDEDGHTPLYHTGVNVTLFDMGIVDVNDHEYDGPSDETPFVQVAEVLLEAGADPWVADRYGTPAIHAFPDEVIEQLLDRQAIRKDRARLDAELPQSQSNHHQEQRL